MTPARFATVLLIPLRVLLALLAIAWVFVGWIAAPATLWGVTSLGLWSLPLGISLWWFGVAVVWYVKER